MPRVFALPALSRWTWLTLPMIGLAVLAVALLLPGAHAVTPPASLALAATVTGVTLLAVLPFLRRRRVTLDGPVLRVAATFYTHAVAVDALDLAHARIVDLAEHIAYRPRLQLNGVHLPGLRAGHYLLGDRKRAFCLLIGNGRVLALPQRDGRMLLLTLLQPQPLLDALRAAATAAAR